MTHDRQEETFYQVVKQLMGNVTSPSELEPILQLASQQIALPPESQKRVLERLKAELTSPSDFLAPPQLPPTIGLMPSAVNAPPRLLVDWGELPQVGAQCRPEFTLLCPAYTVQPEISIRVDSDLDHDPHDARRRPVPDDTGLWSFHVPFKMTSGGLECRAGQYLIEVQISFKDVEPPLPRFYRCSIRLKVSGAGSGGELVIDGAGQSVVNLQGYNLKQFSKVTLKGGQDGMINLQAASGPESPTNTGGPAMPVTTFEYELKVDHEKQSRMPKLGFTSTRRARLDSGAFFFPDGRRTLLFPRPKVTFGRSRESDVVVRFLPSNEEHDSLSKNISRTHFISSLTPEGLELEDKSKSGLELRGYEVKERQVIQSLYSGENQHLQLGMTGLVPEGFELELTIFAIGKDEHREELEYWDKVYREVVHCTTKGTAHMALEAGINGVRYDRVSNLVGEEAYAQLFRELLIGSSPGKCGVLLKESYRAVEARLLYMDRSFWLEALPGASPLTVDGELLAPRTLLPLAPGMEICFGNELARFDQPAQLHL